MIIGQGRPTSQSIDRPTTQSVLDRLLSRPIKSTLGTGKLDVGLKTKQALVFSLSSAWFSEKSQ